MRDNIILLCAILLIGPCIIYTIVRAVKDKNAKSLDAGVKNILQTCNRHLMNSDEKDNYKRDNWKRMILFAVFFFLIMVISIWIPALSAQDNILQYFIGSFLIYLIIIIILAILTIKDTIKLSDYNSVYVIKGYLRDVYIYRGTRVVLAYYDYIQQKYIIKKIMLNTNEIQNQTIEKNRYVDILVQENKRKLKYISLSAKKKMSLNEIQKV